MPFNKLKQLSSEMSVKYIEQWVENGKQSSEDIQALLVDFGIACLSEAAHIARFSESPEDAILGVSFKLGRKG